MTQTGARSESSVTAAPRVSLESVGRVFETSVEAVREVTLEIDPGDFVAFLGPSGCGKSTLLRLVAGLDSPTSGVLTISPPAARQAFVFQDPNLLPWRNVLRNVELPLELAGVARSERRDRAAEAIARVGLSDAARRIPAELSGGMRMRVSLARALVTDPQLLLLDEPFAALDEITRQTLDDQLRELWLERRMTVLFVTHSISEAVFLARRAVMFTRRPARVMLEQIIDLPEVRHASIRTHTRFAEISQRLYDALLPQEEP